MKNLGQKLIRIGKRYWGAICSLHKAWDSPLKFVIETFLTLYFSVSSMESYLTLFFGEGKWQNYLINPLWQLTGLLIIFTLKVLFSDDKEIEEQNEQLKSKIDKKELRDEVREMYEEGKELRDQLQNLEHSDYKPFCYYIDPQRKSSFMDQLKEWETKKRKSFDYRYSLFWTLVPTQQEVPALPAPNLSHEQEQKIIQDTYRLFIWRFEKLGKYLEDLGDEIHEHG